MIQPLQERVPQIDDDTFVADSAEIIGAVTLAAGVSVWPQAVLRADFNQIMIGSHSNVQDGCVIHEDTGQMVYIGEYVTIGHKAVLHGCQIKDRVLIGMGAVVLNGAVIEEGAIVAAGAVVKENMVVPADTLVAGVPAKIIKTLDISERAVRQAHAESYEALWRQNYRENLEECR